VIPGLNYIAPASKII